jgi:hypothetical protein
MQSDNGLVKVASNPTSVPPGLNDGGAAQKADLLRQFASSGNSGDGGLIAQLSNNPFFTAVGFYNNPQGRV